MPSIHRPDHTVEKPKTGDKVTAAHITAGSGVPDEKARCHQMDTESWGPLPRIRTSAIGTGKIREERISRRSQKSIKEKNAVAQMAVEPVSDNSPIFPDTGSTTETPAKQPGWSRGLKTCKNSQHIAFSSRGQFELSVFATPDVPSKVGRGPVGFDLVDRITGRLLGMVFMGTADVDAEVGFMDIEDDGSRERHASLKSARSNVMPAHAGKLGKTAVVHTDKFEMIDWRSANSRPAADFTTAFDRHKTGFAHG